MKRVCPVPKKWQELWEMLPDKQRIDGQWAPPLPLILDGWWYSSDEQKADRLKQHCEWAAEHEALSEVDAFLRSLVDVDWHQADRRW
jgi:hypothetical protein